MSDVIHFAVNFAVKNVVQLKTLKRTYYFSTTTKEDMVEWYELIRDAITHDDEDNVDGNEPNEDDDDHVSRLPSRHTTLYGRILYVVSFWRRVSAGFPFFLL